MKQKLLKVLQLMLLFISILSSSCPSQINYYEPKVPEKLKLYSKNKL